MIAIPEGDGQGRPAAYHAAKAVLRLKNRNS